MLSFRLSEEQYAFLHRLSLSNGARSMSDYARDTLFGMLQPRAGMPSAHLEQKMERLALDVATLAEDVQRLRGLVELQKAVVPE
jgi:hypothetical protein